ncbi:ATP-binding protein [Actinomadura scrupuli]|uniref:PAS domain-containing sensor histidine kinase n=1 Tax=Actinomadura scrupuli TaxID=559629 RepID=UPI003D97A502
MSVPPRTFKIDYESAFQALPAPIVLLTRDFVIVAANEACVRASGHRLEELLGRSVFDAFSGGPADPDANGQRALRASLERVVETGRQDTMALQSRGAEVPGRPGVSAERYWNQINAPVFGPDGELRLIIHRFEEVTAFLRRLRRSGERDTSSTRMELVAIEDEVYARTRELQELNERLRQAHDQQLQIASALQQAIDQQRRFISDASHDLRNPITGLQTRLEDALADPDADPRQVLYSALRDSQRLNDLVADLLELAKLDAATPTPVQPVDLGQLVTEELKSHALTTAVSTRLDPGVVVHASRIRLARLLGNLLTNADRHAAHRIQITVTTDPPDAFLEVVDDGKGIPPAERERVFDRFYRSIASRHLDAGGTGLGLSIAREIAHAYGGDLYVADHPTGGRLVLRLPLATQEAGRPTGQPRLTGL